MEFMSFKRYIMLTIDILEDTKINGINYNKLQKNKIQCKKNVKNLKKVLKNV